MNSFCILLVSLLFTQSLCADEGNLPQKRNLVSDILDKFLTPIYEELSTKNLSIPLIDLGENVGKISNLKGSITGGLTKKVESYGAFGFKLDTTLNNILLSADYNIKHLDLPDLFPIYGKGKAVVTTEKIKLNMILSATYNFLNEKFDIKVENFKLAAANSSVNFDNLMDDPNVTNFLNELISNLLPQLFEMFNEPLLEITEFLADKYGNGILMCIKTERHRLMECIEEVFKTVKMEKFGKFVYSKFADFAKRNV